MINATTTTTTPTQKPPLTFEDCELSAKLFESRSEWSKGAGRYYKAAGKEGWRDDCCKHMLPQKPLSQDSLELKRCKTLASKYKTRVELLHGSPYLYNYILNHGCMDELFKNKAAE